MKTRTGKWSWVLILSLSVSAILVVNPGCRKRTAAGEAAPPGGARDKPEAVEAQKGTAPILGLMDTRLAEIDTYQGWPVLVELEVRHPKLLQSDQAAEPIVIASRGESWTEAISLVVTNSKDQVVDFPFKLKPSAEATLTLDTEKMGTLSWWLAGELTLAIPEGEYRLIAGLDTSGVKKPGIWQGKAGSEPVMIHLAKEPSALSEEQAEQKRLLLAVFAKEAGDKDKAMEYVDALLGARPESLQGLALKAVLLEEGGDQIAAMKTYEKAIAVHGRKYPNADPPYELWDEYNRLVAELLKK